METPLVVYMVGGITVVNSDGSQETVHGALLKGDFDHPEAIQRAGAMLYKEVELMAAGMSETIAGLASSRAFSEETAARLASDLAAIEAVLNGDPDAAVEEGEVAERVLALREELSALRLWREEVTGLLSDSTHLPVNRDEFSLEEVPALLAVALGLIDDADDYVPFYEEG